MQQGGDSSQKKLKHVKRNWITKDPCTPLIGQVSEYLKEVVNSISRISCAGLMVEGARKLLESQSHQIIR